MENTWLGQGIPWPAVAGFGWGLSAGIGKWPSDNAVSRLLWLSPSAVTVWPELWEALSCWWHTRMHTHRLEAAG